MVNRLKKLPPQFRKILKTASFLADSLGCEIYLVEGDAIIFAKKLADRLKAKFSRHHNFGTATLYFGEQEQRVDFATARTEEYAYPGALPKVKPASLVKDILRRDFSINAMAISLNKASYGTLIDLCKGADDLKKGLIRILHPKSFQDDPTRILRAIRFEQRFSFKIEPRTFKLMKQALKNHALELVGPHRLRDEIILTLKESKPYQCIRRIERLAGFAFLDQKIKLNAESFRIFLRIEKASNYYKKKFKKHRKLDVWLLYLAAILIKLSPLRIKRFFQRFGFRKGEKAIINSVREGLKQIKKLSRDAKPSDIYRALKAYSFESILFFYAYYQNKRLRKNIEHFLAELASINLKIKGKDLKRMGLKPYNLYSKVLRCTLYSKLDKGLKGKRKEAKEVERIFKQQKRILKKG
jgi:tRNA nucleotidyltransferase (CCA-adding enzyme)